MNAADRRTAFRVLHEGGIFALPNVWDAGSARLLEAVGAAAVATTSAGLAWTLGRADGQVTRDELVTHVGAVVAATVLPVSADSERLFSDDLAGVAETVRLLAAAGAAGCSIEDWDPGRGQITPLDEAVARVVAAATAARAEGLVLTARAENLLHGVEDLEDTIARLDAYRAAGADVVYAPGLTSMAEISAVVSRVAAPVNVLALPGVPDMRELGALGVRRVSTGSLLASAAYGAAARGARSLVEDGTYPFQRDGLPRDLRDRAFGG